MSSDRPPRPADVTPALPGEVEGFTEFIRRRAMDVQLADGARLLIRPIVPGDKRKLVEALHRLSPESRYRRFMSPIRDFSEQELIHLTEVDYVDHFAWVAQSLDEPGEPGAGVARYIRLGSGDVAEAAVAVVDPYQGRGLGTLLLEALGLVAMQNGIRCFRAYVLPENRPMLEVIKHEGGRVVHSPEGVLQVDVDLPSREGELKKTSVYAILRAVARGEAEPPQHPVARKRR